MNFDQAVEFVLKEEGGYVDDPNDPGGATKYGITERVARANGYLGHMMDLPLAKAKAIYRKDYWDKCRCDELPASIRLPMFDAAVNSGPRVSIKWLQKVLGVEEDGQFGPITMDSVNAIPRRAIFVGLISVRLLYLTDLQTWWPRFGKGWTKRIARMISTCT